jgi:hypothetical protein
MTIAFDLIDPITPPTLAASLAHWERVAEENAADLERANETVATLHALLTAASLRNAALVGALRTGSVQLATLRADADAARIVSVTVGTGNDRG